jgi:voltage-gated potassium channel
MDFTFEFIRNLARSLGDGAPLFAGLMSIIAALAIVVGWIEGWSVGDSLYYGFITATTVGYGDLHPTGGIGKFVAVVLALVGLILTGIIVGLAVEAASFTYEHSRQRRAR